MDGNHQVTINKLKDIMSKHFSMTNMASTIINYDLEVDRSDAGFFISQKSILWTC